MKEESLLDDETLWFGYAKAFCPFPSGTISEKADAADEMLKEHCKRFPRRKK